MASGSSGTGDGDPHPPVPPRVRQHRERHRNTMSPFRPRPWGAGGTQGWQERGGECRGPPSRGDAGVGCPQPPQHDPETARSPAPSTRRPRSPVVPLRLATLCSALGKLRHGAGQGQPEGAGPAAAGDAAGSGRPLLLGTGGQLGSARHLARTALAGLTTAHSPAIPLTSG